MEMADPIVFQLDIQRTDDPDGRQRDVLLRTLYSELAALPLDSKRFISENPPEGTKSVIGILSAILVEVGPKILAKLFGYLYDYVSRPGNQTIEIELKHGARRVKITYVPGEKSSEAVAEILRSLKLSLAESKNR